MPSPVDYNALREEVVLAEEAELARRFGRTSRGGAASCSRPMTRDGREGWNTKYGRGQRLNIRTRLGQLQRAWERWRPRQVERPDEGEAWCREVAWLRDQLGLKEEDVSKGKTKVTKDDILKTAQAAFPNGLTAAEVDRLLGVDRVQAKAVLHELETEGKLRSRPGKPGPHGGRVPVEFYDADPLPPPEREALKKENQGHELDADDDLNEVINRVRDILVAYTKRRVGVALAEHRKQVVDAFDRALTESLGKTTKEV